MGLNLPIKRSDFARYLLLHAFGGVYLDLDMQLKDSLWPVSKQTLSLTCVLFSIVLLLLCFIAYSTRSCQTTTQS
jgi:uncharacterized membrane protein YgdD (TMEM256/DUF423 family)